MNQPGLFAEPIAATATISPCGLYRYDLTRTWGPSDEPGRKACFVMLNPSKADADRPDPTMTRCFDFAKSWGYDGLAIVNLFAFRATDPRDLWLADDPIGPENGRHITRWTALAGIVVCAWGAEPKAKARATAVLRYLEACMIVPYALRVTADGSPGHPLYLPSHLTPTPMEATR